MVSGGGGLVRSRRDVPQVSSLLPPNPKNWGDRPFIAVGPEGTVYVTWDYGPERTSVTYLCAAAGSCAFATGDLNVVIEKSRNRGRSWSPMSYISPGFPASGGDSGPFLVEPGGRIDVLYQGYRITNTTTYTMKPAHSYFTSSTDQGATWSRPVTVGPHAGSMSLAEWWIGGAFAMDAAGNLYATWDTQGTNRNGTSNDTGWLSFSTDHGGSWSPPLQVPADRRKVPQIMEVAAGGSGIAYVGWLSEPFQVSTQFGDSSVWPGDTFGISALSANQLVLSWGGAVPATGKKSQIFAANIGVHLP